MPLHATIYLYYIYTHYICHDYSEPRMSQLLGMSGTFTPESPEHPRAQELPKPPAFADDWGEAILGLGGVKQGVRSAQIHSDTKGSQDFYGFLRSVNTKPTKPKQWSCQAPRLEFAAHIGEIAELNDNRPRTNSSYERTASNSPVAIGGKSKAKKATDITKREQQDQCGLPQLSEPKCPQKGSESEKFRSRTTQHQYSACPVCILRCVSFISSASTILLAD